MPLYEYKCSGCGKTFEVIQKFADEPLKTHPECGGPVERLLSAPALQFKGSGWYVTDYARSKDPQANGSSKSEGGSDAAKTGSGDKKTGSGDKKSGSDSSSSESKPAASSDNKSSSSSSSTSNPK
jgi:putative FmdB family regulatory protein